MTTISRTFGAVRGAGTQVNEVAGSEEVVQGALGTTVLIGVLERGEENGIIYTRSPSEYVRRCGSLLDASDFNTPSFASLNTPLNAKHFLNHAKGAGPLIMLRVAPIGNDAPLKSRINVFNREASPKLIGYIDANNGGNWGGKRKVYISDLSNVPAIDFPAANQIQLRGLIANTLVDDEFKNGTVYLDGLPGTTYTITASTDQGLLTLEDDDDVATDWGSGETYGTEDSDAETFNFGTLAGPWTVSAGTETGGPDVATMTSTKASITNASPPSFPMVAGKIVFTLSADGGVTSNDYTVEFNAEATLAAVLAVLNAGLPGCSAEDDGIGNVIVYTDQQGTGAYLVINDAASDTATVNCVFGSATPIETTGTGDMENHFAVTADEIATALTTAIGLGTSGATAVAVAGICTVTTGLVGSLGWVAIAGTLGTFLGFDGVHHAGTDGPADFGAIILKDNYNQRDISKHLAVEFKDGGLRRDTEFGMIVRVDGSKVLSYENLSMVSTASNYWVNVVNDDKNNDIIIITDNFAGDRTLSAARPANHFGISGALTATRLTIADPYVSNLSVGVGAWGPALTWNSWGMLTKPQRLKVMTDGATNLTITTDQGNETWSGTVGGAAIDMGDFVGTMTIATDTGAETAGDWFYIYLKPLEPDEAIGGKVFPDVEDAAYKNLAFTIIDNTATYVDVSPMVDLTNGALIAAGKQYRIEYRQQAGGGYDGYVAGMTTTNYERLLDSSTSPLRQLQNKGLGLVKVAVPGGAYITDGTNLSKKLKQFTYDMNWMAKVEIPWSMHDWDVYNEYSLADWADNTFVRDETSAHSSVVFPCFAYVEDPLAVLGSESRLRLVPSVGLVLGEEARIAKQYGNHHKAPAGTDAKLPEIIKLPVVGKPDNPIRLDHEILNPAGINILKWNMRGTSVIIWGDRSLSQNATFKFYHKRNLLSQYEIDLLEGFDFTIFDINDSTTDDLIIAALMDYFRPEWVKRAIRGSAPFGGSYPACTINMGPDINTDAVRGAGEAKVEIALRLADTLERLRIFIGPMGLAEGA